MSCFSKVDCPEMSAVQHTIAGIQRGAGHGTTNRADTRALPYMATFDVIVSSNNNFLGPFFLLLEFKTFCIFIFESRLGFALNVHNLVFEF